MRSVHMTGAIPGFWLLQFWSPCFSHKVETMKKHGGRYFLHKIAVAFSLAWLKPRNMTSGNKIDYALGAVVSRLIKRIDIWDLNLLHLRFWPQRESTQVNRPFPIIIVIITIVSIIITIFIRKAIWHSLWWSADGDFREIRYPGKGKLPSNSRGLWNIATL